MKYILLAIFFFFVGVYHLLDIIIRTILNLFILTWDLKWAKVELHSYKEVYIFGDSPVSGKSIKISQLYSYDYHFKDFQ